MRTTVVLSEDLSVDYREAKDKLDEVLKRLKDDIMNHIDHATARTADAPEPRVAIRIDVNLRAPQYVWAEE